MLGEVSAKRSGTAGFIQLIHAATVTLFVLLSAAAQSQIVQSENDPRAYRYTELANGLPILLISDPQTTKAAASLDVHVGSGDDPQDRPGLAHFLEHMLFLGTEKYPEAGDYQGYLSQHGGSHNAYTSQHHTNYFFDVDVDYFEGALDRFAQFFVAPLFTAKYVDKERNAVHSEYQAKIQDEYRRGFDVVRQVVNPAHPAAKFSVGSLATLADKPGDAVREDLLAFYQRYYSATNMRLVVLGPQSLAELEAMVASRFQSIKRFEVKLDPEPALFLPGSLPQAVFIKPLKNMHSLSVIFPVPDIGPFYRQKPTEFIGNLLGHEGEGSLLSALKTLGWAEGLGAGANENGRESATFMVSVSLTPEGEQHVDEILALIFKTINEIKGHGLESWRYHEQQVMAEMAFRYQEKRDPVSTVRSLADALHSYSVEDVLRGRYLFEQFDKPLISRFLDSLRPDNMLVTLTSLTVTTDQTSPQYSTPYRVAPVAALFGASESSPDLQVNGVLEHYSSAAVEKVSRELGDLIALPAANPFIPEPVKSSANAVVAEKAAVAVPEKVVERKNLTIWYARDNYYHVPKANIQLRLLSPATSASLTGAAQTEMYAVMLNDVLNEFSYPASLAGLNFQLRATNRGLDLEVAGFADRQQFLLDEIFKQMRRAKFSETRFQLLKAELLRQWRNRKLQAPYQQLLQALPVALYSPYWAADDLADALAQISFSEFKAFAGQLYKGATATMLVYGDLPERVPAEIGKSLRRVLARGQSGASTASASVVKLSGQENPWLVVPVSHPDRTAVWYLQGLDDSLRDKAHMLVLRQALQAPFYEHLRTEKQLGYIVGAYGMPIKEVPGTALVVQSPSASLQTVVDSMQAFVSDFAVAPDTVATFKQAVLTELLDPPQNLFQQGEVFWSNILRQQEGFDWAQRVAKEVENISAESLKKYLESVTKTDRKGLLITTDQPLVATDLQRAETAAAFKRGRPGYRYP